MARILIHIGDGKGKTTAALGTVLRAAGRGLRCFVLQFLKSDVTVGEVRGLAALPAVTHATCGLGFVPKPTLPAFEKHRDAACAGWEQARVALAGEDYDLIVLDEVLDAIQLGLLEEVAVYEALHALPAEKIVILTGRQASPALQDLADTVTEMKALKHAYEQGRPAQAGVEM